MSWTESGQQFIGTDAVVKNGCHLDEVLTAPHFLGVENYRATSTSQWDSTRRQWVQRYRDNQGTVTFLGSFAGGEMVLTATNTSVMQRATWRDIKSDSLVWELDTSSDAGTTWNAALVINYTRS